MLNRHNKPDKRIQLPALTDPVNITVANLKDKAARFSEGQGEKEKRPQFMTFLKD